MAQYLKEHVQRDIVDAALDVFARRGYARATVAAIARRAGTSTGNVYRYFDGKEALLRSAIGDGFVRRFRALLRRRVRSLRGIAEVAGLPAGAPYHLASEELLAFCIEHRREVVFLLGRAQGSPYESFSQRTVDDLTRLAVDHFRQLDPARTVTPAIDLALRHIYRSLVLAMVDILSTFEEEGSLREAVAAYTRFHLSGLNALFG